jgi:hypothetical protein
MNPMNPINPMNPMNPMHVKSASTQRRHGLFDRLEFPATITANVVDIGDGTSERRIAGYAVESDLAAHHDFVAVSFLALRGELPTPAERAAFSTALTLLSPTSVAESAGHATVLARVAAAPDEVVGAVIASAVGQDAKAEVASHAELCAFVDGAGDAPASCITTDAAAVARYAEVVARSSTWFAAPLPHTPALTRVATAHALLAKLGLRTSLELHGVSLLARLPVLLGEARHVAIGSVTRYAARTPDYHYVEET